MFRFCFSLLSIASLALVGCATSGDAPPAPNAEVIASHAGIYLRVPATNPPKTAPYLYLQQGMDLYVTGKTRRGYSQIITAGDLNCWVLGEFLGPIGSAEIPEAAPLRDYSKPRPRPRPHPSVL